MGSITIREYEYGHPKNEDYAYDTFREERDMEAAIMDKRNLEFLEDTRLEARDAMRNIIACYDLAITLEETKIPTPLMAAIETARKVVA